MMPRTKKRHGGGGGRLTEIVALKAENAKLREKVAKLTRLLYDQGRAADATIARLQEENADLKRRVELGIQSVRIERPGAERHER
jgi:hypothetical protein